MDGPFTQKEFIQMGVALAARGACGAILKILWDAYQGRVQPVSFKTRFLRVFKDTIGPSSLRAELQVTDGVETRQFHNLFVAEVTIVNTGNAHIEEFNFGQTLGGDDVAIFTEPIVPDRHHTMVQTSRVAVGAAAHEVDFVCKPFNRKDKYTVKVFLSIPIEKTEPDDIVPSTSYPVTFVNADKYETFVIALINALAKQKIVERTRVQTDKL